MTDDAKPATDQQIDDLRLVGSEMIRGVIARYDAEKERADAAEERAEAEAEEARNAFALGQDVRQAQNAERIADLEAENAELRHWIGAQNHD